MTVRKVLILGGYGNFGKRIAKNLSELKDIVIFIAGRNLKRAEAFCQELSLSDINATLTPVKMDIFSPTLVDELQSLSPDLVIHTGGPFQGQDYRVPKACIVVGSHYIDLADDRRFVCDITSLNDQAQAGKVLVISGASSVPGLSSTVIDSFINQFVSLEEIDFSIAPGNKADRGKATVRGILSYTGHPFSVFYNGQWINQYGWMSPRRLYFDDSIGKRWLANVDIPDLELFPKRYKSVNTVRFQAGLELSLLHFGMVFMAFLAKMGWVKDWSAFTNIIYKSSEFFKIFGTDNGGMQINLLGRDKNNAVKHIKWTLCAKHNIGPYIPTLSAIILARKLIAGTINKRGATPCLGLFTMQEFYAEATALGITYKTEEIIG